MHPGTEPSTTKTQPDPKKLEEAAVTIIALKHCLSLDGGLNQYARLIDAYNIQPDLDNLPEDITGAEKEKALLYTMGRPDIPDFGFLIPATWRLTNRDARIKFDAILTLHLAETLGFKNAAQSYNNNCKPIIRGDITKDTKGFSHASIIMPLSFEGKETQINYLMLKQETYNWQIQDLLINDVGITNYIKKDLGKAVTTKGIDAVTNELCKTANTPGLQCQK